MTISRPAELYKLRLVRDESTRQVTLIARDSRDEHKGETTCAELGADFLLTFRYPTEAAQQYMAELASQNQLDIDWQFNKRDLEKLGFDPDELEP
jgi:hypothetical protein